MKTNLTWITIYIISYIFKETSVQTKIIYFFDESDGARKDLNSVLWCFRRRAPRRLTTRISRWVAKRVWFCSNAPVGGCAIPSELNGIWRRGPIQYTRLFVVFIFVCLSTDILFKQRWEKNDEFGTHVNHCFKCMSVCLWQMQNDISKDRWE